MSQDNRETGRRRVLKHLGATTTAAGLGVVGVTHASAAEGIEVSKASNSDGLISEATESKEFTEVQRSLQEMGIQTDVRAGVAKETNAPQKLQLKHGVMFPLRGLSTADIWEGVDEAQLNASGHLLWGRQPDGSTETTAVLVGYSGEGVSKASLRHVVDPEDEEATSAVALVNPSGIMKQVKDGSRPQPDDPVQAKESVLQCQFDNVGLLGSSDDVITCAACLYPGNGLGAGDILECLYCGSQLAVQHCVIGYCMNKEHKYGDEYCVVVAAVSKTPLSLLPGGYTTALKTMALAQAAGCDADEGTDCTSPFVP